MNPIDKEKIEKAIEHLRTHYSQTDNLSFCLSRQKFLYIYDHFPAGGLNKELYDIQESITYLESLIVGTE